VTKEKKPRSVTNQIPRVQSAPEPPEERACMIVEISVGRHQGSGESAKNANELHGREALGGWS